MLRDLTIANKSFCLLGTKQLSSKTSILLKSTIVLEFKKPKLFTSSVTHFLCETRIDKVSVGLAFLVGQRVPDHFPQFGLLNLSKNVMTSKAKHHI